MPRRKSRPAPHPRPRITVLGGANTDFLIRGARLPRPGETVTGEEFDHAVAGGKGANQAVAAARLGASVTFLGRVGADDRGRALLRRLKEEGVDVRHVTRDPRAATGVALISVDATGEKQILVAPGANQHLNPADIRRPAVARAITQADVLILQFEVPMAANLAAARLAHRAGVPIVLDPAPAVERDVSSSPTKRAPRKTGEPIGPGKETSALLRLVTILRANEHETEALTGIAVNNRTSAQQAAVHLLEKFGSLRAAIIAAGKGNLAVWRASAPSINHQLLAINFLFLHPLRVKAVDATGAGDAFAAALAVALADGNDVPTAASFANAAAALTTTQLGAQAALPRREAVMALRQRRC